MKKIVKLGSFLVLGILLMGAFSSSALYAKSRFSFSVNLNALAPYYAPPPVYTEVYVQPYLPPPPLIQERTVVQYYPTYYPAPYYVYPNYVYPNYVYPTRPPIIEKQIIHRFP